MMLFAKDVRFSWGIPAALVLLVLWGFIKIPMESHLASEQERLRFHGVKVTREIRDQVGQGTALALMSGFRGFVADMLWIRAHQHWEKKEWFRMRTLLELVCTLQPRSVLFWENSCWHLAWNVSHDAFYNQEEPRLARRVKAQKEWIDAGRDLLARGLKNIPDKYDLWFQMGWLLSQKYKDHAGAAEYYRKAITFPEAPLYIRRSVGYSLEQAGKLDEAYAYWKELWLSESDKNAQPYMMWDRIQARIVDLEQKLSIPQADRVVFQK